MSLAEMFRQLDREVSRLLADLRDVRHQAEKMAHENGVLCDENASLRAELARLKGEGR